MTIDKCRTCKHAFTTGKDRLYCKKSLADKDDCGEYSVIEQLRVNRMDELKLNPCYCGGEMKIEKVAKNGGMDGTYWDWELTCTKCGLTKSYAADGFYGRAYKTFEEVVEDWNKKVKPPTGHWIIMGGRYIKCSECRHITKTESPDIYNFCMVCGKRMIEPQESEG